MGELRPSEVERIKLTANFLNGVASGVVLAATVAPFIGVNLGTVKPTADLLGILALSLLGIVLAVVLHLIARRLLLRLDE